MQADIRRSRERLSRTRQAAMERSRRHELREERKEFSAKVRWRSEVIVATYFLNDDARCCSCLPEVGDDGVREGANGRIPLRVWHGDRPGRNVDAKMGRRHAIRSGDYVSARHRCPLLSIHLATPSPAWSTFGVGQQVRATAEGAKEQVAAAMERYGSKMLPSLTVWGTWDPDLYVEHNNDVEDDAWEHFQSESHRWYCRAFPPLPPAGNTFELSR